MPLTLPALVRRLVDVRVNEGRALVWSFVYYFLVLTAYYILRPIRDEMGVVGGVENLSWLFTGTLVGMLLLQPLYGSLVAAWPRQRFVPFAHRFFAAHLVLFFFAFGVLHEGASVWAGRLFFIWVSVFNLFVVSVFWSFMTDLYSSEQGKRLFGALAIGGTLGAMFGSTLTSYLVVPLGSRNLLLASAVCLELAVRASSALGAQQPRLDAARAADESTGEGSAASSSARATETIGGGPLEGLRHVLASPYLLGIAGVMLFFTISTTFLYFQQAELTARLFGDRSAERTRFFAQIDLLVNGLTLATQLFLTGRLLRRFGLAFGLAFLPAVSVLGFGALAIVPSLMVLVVLQVLRRAGNYAIHRPAREVLYTVLPRTDKYKAKNFNDTFVYRFGDQIGAWSSPALAALGLSFAGLATAMLPFCALWLCLALWLAARCRRLQLGSSPAPAKPALAAGMAG